MDRIKQITDQDILGTEGLSRKAPRITARGILRNQQGLYAVMYAQDFSLYSLPGGGKEEGEALLDTLQRELLEGGYPADTPVAVVYKATWPDERIFRCTVETLHETVTSNGLTKTSLIIVGNCMGDKYLRSLLYHPGFTTEFREASE